MHSAFPQPLQYSRNRVRRQAETPVFIGFLKSLYILKARGNGRPPVAFLLPSRCVPVAFLLHSCCIPVAYVPRYSASARRDRRRNADESGCKMRGFQTEPFGLCPFTLPSPLRPCFPSCFPLGIYPSFLLYHYVPQISHETPINKGRNGNFSASDFAGVAGASVPFVCFACSRFLPVANRRRGRKLFCESGARFFSRRQKQSSTIFRDSRAQNITARAKPNICTKPLILLPLVAFSA